MLPYERFEAWQKAHALTLAVYAVTHGFPSDERFGLTAQARRAAYSTAANIAEGSAKNGPREFKRYLDISIGSLSELAHALYLARDLGYLSDERWVKVESLRGEAGKLCWALYRSLGRR